MVLALDEQYYAIWLKDPLRIRPEYNSEGDIKDIKVVDRGLRKFPSFNEQRFVAKLLEVYCEDGDELRENPKFVFELYNGGGDGCVFEMPAKYMEYSFSTRKENRKPLGNVRPIQLFHELRESYIEKISKHHGLFFPKYRFDRREFLRNKRYKGKIKNNSKKSA